MSENKRKYTKKSEYWEQRKKASDVIQATPAPIITKSRVAPPDVPSESIGEPFTAVASLGGGSSSYRVPQSKAQSSMRECNRYENLREGLLPWEYSGSVISMQEVITLCQKAHANVASFRNTIEVITEFSNAKLILKGGNKRARDFIYQLWKKQKMDEIKENAFRELALSGNWFAYRVDGKMRDEDFNKMKEITAAKTNVLPLTYITLNPATIGVENGIAYKNSYVKMLSMYEIERLKNPTTPEEQEIYNALPAEVKAQLKKSSGIAQTIYMPLDPKRLHYLFNKKQAYQALALPMGFPVLNDIEFKLQLKKMDMALARTIEHVILLIKSGETPTEHGGGVNPKAIERLQQLFKNETVGRVLVAPYDTTAEWVVPDIGKIIGKEKYDVVNKDIQDGLQMILMGEEKFSNSQTKIKVFLERLKSGQHNFLRNFLQPEIERICEAMNFKNVPTAEFEKIDLEDKTNAFRVYIRMAELGLLTPDELNTVMETGILPDKESNIEAQKEYKELRDKGYYFPLVGGSKEEEGEGGRPSGSSGPKKSGKIGTSKASIEEEKYSFKNVVGNLSIASALEEKVTETLKKKYKLNKLNEAQEVVANILIKTIIANEVPEHWTKSVDDYIAKPKEIPANIASEIDDIAIRYETDTYMAAILYRSKI